MTTFPTTTTHAFRPHDRVEMTAAGHRACSRQPQHTTGIVTRVSKHSIEVLRDGCTQPTWFPAGQWRRCAESEVGSAEWLERRAYAAAFARA